jgi:Gamma-glutamyl cyclotransferase, AIG2-like
MVKNYFKLFSYGTLQYEAVQLATFGRKLAGTPDVLLGYRLEKIKINDPKVVEVSGDAEHLVLIPVENPAEFEKHQVKGMVFEITPEELQQADDYEVDAYKRVKVSLLSGNTAWAYVLA